ncbi:Hypothetical protein R9X50_00546400 [Acrodontium crateriforme]|uniref:HECT-type E3 ubiquitin transferase n=1 Tax=Acrodontium crateriforme TaxID=150365 RepID=A0AAQ3M6K0_9PEZI|nr:Hypothetical protein R9X50_00546400 [Acrodontium crateriforme]
MEYLIEQYSKQLYEGCGNNDCTSALCHTGRINKNAPAPTRRYTARSVRGLAITLASDPSPEQYLCPYLKAGAEPGKVPRPDGPRDPTSFMQQLSDSTAIKAAFSQIAIPRGVAVDPVMRLYHSLDPLFTGIPSNIEALDLIIQSMEWVTEASPLIERFDTEDAYWRALTRANEIIGAGYAYPRVHGSGHFRHIQNSLVILDRFEDRGRIRLMTRAFEAISRRTALEDALKECSINSKTHHERPSSAVTPRSSVKQRLVHMIAKTINSNSVFGEYGTSTFTEPVLWARKIFWREWNGKTKIRRGTAACGALEYMEALYAIHKCDTATRAAWDLPSMNFHLQITEMAKSWLEDDESFRHVLSFGFLFQSQHRNSRLTCFRMINHLKMQKSHNASIAARRLRLKAAPSTAILTPEGRLKYTEDPYLVLRISRHNQLKDAYDQIWQRRRDELFRPLRVRLGDDFDEIGQDLGGVQLEFFNLLCNNVFAEDAGLFVAADNGVCFFQPMSLQPLYMFELFGLFVSLALYNGITLPINLPMTFYRQLLEDSPEDCDLSTLDQLEDIWPDEVKMLGQIDPAIVERDYTIPIQAHDVVLEVRPTSRVHEGRLVLDVYNAYSASREVDIEAIADAWPGWHLVQALSDAPVITPENKQQYLDDRVRWLIHDSVKPQWEAFRRGFFNIIDHRSISLFNPESFQLLTEGKKADLDIVSLEKATTYKDFDRTSKYIRMFWRMVSKWSPKQQMDLVKFVTAVERIPCGGPARLTFVIQKAETATADSLPTSSTCFGVLRLPVYPDLKTLEEKMLKAMEYGGEGFGMV